jgi:hypothetical protein
MARLWKCSEMLARVAPKDTDAASQPQVECLFLDLQPRKAAGSAALN